MNPRRESKSESYDVIVIGAGMGGLSAAAFLAKAGKRVLVIERHDVPGGYAHAFRRKKYVFDAAVHLTSGCEKGGLIDSILRMLGTRDQCEFLKVDPFYSAIFPGMKFQAPAAAEAFFEAHCESFPGDAKGFRKLFKEMAGLFGEVTTLPPDMGILDMIRMPRKFPRVVKYHKATVGQVTGQHLTDPRSKAVFTTLWPYLGLPPSRLSFLYFTTMLFSYLRDGTYYAKGSFQKLPNAVVQGIRDLGSEVLLSTSVRRILVEKNRVQGVVTGNGQKILAPVVVSNADVMETFGDMVGETNTPARYMKRLRKMKPSLSAFVVYMATDLDLKSYGALHEEFIYRSWDHEATYAGMTVGRPTGIVTTIPTLVDPSLAPKGEHIVVVTTLIPYDIGSSWRKEKERYVESLNGELEAAYPDLRGHITFAEGASPRTMERYTLNLTGAIYGWELSPEQTGRHRLGNEAPLKGLYLAGHWVQPGGGIMAVMVSGAMAAQKILGYESFPAMIGELGAA